MKTTDDSFSDGVSLTALGSTTCMCLLAHPLTTINSMIEHRINNVFLMVPPFFVFDYQHQASVATARVPFFELRRCEVGRIALQEKEPGSSSPPGHMHSTLFPTPAARLQANQPQTSCRGSAKGHPKGRARP